jgi:hypothetical protein
MARLPAARMIFLDGPRAGQRVALTASALLVGRGGDCQIDCREQTVSRRQCRLFLGGESWCMENLSRRGTRVNGRRIRGSKRVLLDTGDVLEMGQSTRILYVAAGDDVAAAVAAAAPPQQGPAPAPAVETEDASAETESDPPDETPREPGDRRDDAPAEPVDPQRQARRRKLRRYAVAGGVYVGILLVGAILLASLKGRGGDGRTAGMPVRLRDEQIADAVKEPLSRQVNAQLAAEHLARAETLFPDRHFRPGNLHETVKHFKLHRAYVPGGRFSDPGSELDFRRSQKEYIARICELSRQAWVHASDRKFERAERFCRELLALVPSDAQWDTPGYRRLQENLFQHAAYVRRRLTGR